MSVQAFLAVRQQIRELAKNPPACWGIAGASVYAAVPGDADEDASEFVVLALFDTKELTEAYVAASRLPEPFRYDGRYQRFRPDSLLWNYRIVHDGIGTLTTSVADLSLSEIDTLPVNPAPPSAPLEEVLAPYKAELVAEALK